MRFLSPQHMYGQFKAKQVPGGSHLSEIHLHLHHLISRLSPVSLSVKEKLIFLQNAQETVASQMKAGEEI